MESYKGEKLWLSADDQMAGHKKVRDGQKWEQFFYVAEEWGGTSIINTCFEDDFI